MGRPFSLLLKKKKEISREFFFRSIIIIMETSSFLQYRVVNMKPYIYSSFRGVV